MTEPRLPETSSRAARIQDALNNIGSWLLDVVSVDPGWSEMVLDVKPLAGQIFVRVREFRDGEEFIGTIGPPTTVTAALGLPPPSWWRRPAGPTRSSAWVPPITVTMSLQAGRTKAP